MFRRYSSFVNTAFRYSTPSISCVHLHLVQFSISMIMQQYLLDDRNLSSVGVSKNKMTTAQVFKHACRNAAFKCLFPKYEVHETQLLCLPFSLKTMSPAVQRCSCWQLPGQNMRALVKPSDSDNRLVHIINYAIAMTD